MVVPLTMVHTVSQSYQRRSTERRTWSLQKEEFFLSNPTQGIWSARSYTSDKAFSTKGILRFEHLASSGSWPANTSWFLGFTVYHQPQDQIWKRCFHWQRVYFTELFIEKLSDFWVEQSLEAIINITIPWTAFLLVLHMRSDACFTPIVCRRKRQIGLLDHLRMTLPLEADMTKLLKLYPYCI